MTPASKLLLSSLLALAVGLGSAGLSAEIVERVIARVNGDIVTLSEFEARQLAAVQQARVPSSGVEAWLRENNARLLEEAVEELLILQRGADLGIRLRPEYVQEVVESIKKENNIADDAELAQQLRREGMSLADLRRNIERSIVRRQVLTRELEGKTAVTEAEARAEYEKTRGQYTKNESLRLEEILVPAGDAELARALVGRARKGEDFAALARAHSISPTRDAGGDLGRLSRGELNPGLEQAAFALAEGAISEPLPGEGGIRILRVSGREKGTVVPFEEAREEITKRLAQERAATVYADYVAGLRKTAQVQTLVSEVPLQLTAPLEASPSRLTPPGGAPGAPDAEIVTTPQARPERVAPPPAGGAPAPAPSPTPSPAP